MNPAARLFFHAVEGKMIEERYRSELFRADQLARQQEQAEDEEDGDGVVVPREKNHNLGGSLEEVRKTHYQRAKRIEAQQDWTQKFLGTL